MLFIVKSQTTCLVFSVFFHYSGRWKTRIFKFLSVSVCVNGQTICSDNKTFLIRQMSREIMGINYYLKTKWSTKTSDKLHMYMITTLQFVQVMSLQKSVWKFTSEGKNLLMSVSNFTWFCIQNIRPWYKRVRRQISRPLSRKHYENWPK